ncbi:MAG: hypothetical protein HKN60_05180, partial [Rhizobiales bacterium]|nr:hypothetical protein [Hyphomicrobiales bacterium]
MTDHITQGTNTPAHADTVERQAGRTLWRELAEAIRHEITEAGTKAGERIASEST